VFSKAGLPRASALVAAFDGFRIDEELPSATAVTPVRWCIRGLHTGDYLGIPAAAEIASRMCEI
jgi:hypothetical protein